MFFWYSPLVAPDDDLPYVTLWRPEKTANLFRSAVS
jgi:hypothetical protein